jgi:hydroxymethylglutaryl-CoA synthase
MTAAQWIASGAARGRKALVIATDIARYEIGSAGEPTQGAGAVAMVVSPDPRLLAIDFRRSGSFAAGVFDFWRPLDRREAVVDGKYSLDCYLRALEGAYGDYRAAADGGDANRPPLADRFRAFLYHTPFPKMAWKAHRRLLEIDWTEFDQTLTEWEREALAKASFESTVGPYLAACREVGNTYTASLYFCLATLLEEYGRTLAGERIALFSYGSGCCAEFFSGLVGPLARNEPTGLGELLRSRRTLSVEEYETLRSQTEPEGAVLRPVEGFQGHFSYAGTEDHRRQYFSVPR